MLRQRAARGLLAVDEAWALTGTLLSGADPASRVAGLSLASLFAGDIAEPAVPALESDPDPEVAAPARDALAAVARVRRADQL